MIKNKFFKSSKIMLSGMLIFASCSSITNVVSADVENKANSTSNISSNNESNENSKTLKPLIELQNNNPTSSNVPASIEKPNNLLVSSKASGQSSSQMPTQASVSKTPALATYTWGGLTLTIDNLGVLHIPGGSVTSPPSIATTIGIASSNIKAISIDGDLVLSGSGLNIFANFPLLEQIDNLNNLNTINTTTMKGFFSNCPSLKSLNLSSFDTAKVTNMDTMFYNNASLNELDLSHFNTASLTSMTMMFGFASNLTGINISSFDTSKVKSMVSVFHGCTSLQTLNISNFSTESAVSMINMFNGCSNLNSLTFGSQFQFKGDTALPEISSSDIYTGKWQSVGTGNIQNPEGPIVKTTSELVNSYNGNTDSDTYVWQKFATPIDVFYHDENGNPIHGVANDLIKGVNGDVVFTEEYQRDVPTYTLDTTKLPDPQIKLSTLPQSPIIFTYVKNQGTVRIKFQNKEGHQISEDQIIVGDEGTGFDTTSNIIKISGYYLNSKKLPTNSTGMFSNQEQTVTYIYDKDLSVINVHNSTVYVGSNWNPNANFESATDKEGNKIGINSISVNSNEVNINQVGEYKIYYTLGDLTVTATLTVVNKEPTLALPDSNIKKGGTPSIGNHSKNEGNLNKSMSIKNVKKINSASTLPRTGEIQQKLLMILGALILGLTISFCILKKHLQKKS